MGNIKILLLIILSLVAFVSCDWIGHEPTIEGKGERYFDYKAQEHTLKIVRRDGGRYDHQVDWYINELYLIDRYGHAIGKRVKWVDTLTNGDMRISVDWVTCIVPRDKASVRVVLQENETDSTRRAYFNARGMGKIGEFDLTIYQHPQGK